MRLSLFALLLLASVDGKKESEMTRKKKATEANIRRLESFERQFYEMDTDEDGVVTRDEFNYAYRVQKASKDHRAAGGKPGEPIADEFMARHKNAEPPYGVFEHSDGDENGVIELDEFLEAADQEFAGKLQSRRNLMNQLDEQQKRSGGAIKAEMLDENFKAEM